MTANFAKNLPHPHARQAEVSALAATLDGSYGAFAVLALLSWLPDQFFLTGFAFVHRDDLQIVASRFQNKRFVHFAR